MSDPFTLDWPIHRGDYEKALRERDAARAELTRALAETRALHDRYEAVEKERDALRKALEDIRDLTHYKSMHLWPNARECVNGIHNFAKSHLHLAGKDET